MGQICVIFFPSDFAAIIYWLIIITPILHFLYFSLRGLTHAYWAPNFWAIYNAADRLIMFLCKKFGMSSIIGENCHFHQSASTSGLVQDTVHCVLPSIPPIITLIFTVATMIPLMWKLWLSKGDSIQFLRAVILCNFCSFMFGW